MKVHTNNDYDCAFNSLKVLYRKQSIFNFDNRYEILDTGNNVEVIQMFHKNFFDLESFLNDIYDRPGPRNVNINYVFQTKKSRHTLVIVKSSMARQSLDRIIRKTVPTEMHRGKNN